MEPPLTAQILEEEARRRGVSHRRLIRWRGEGLLPVEQGRRGLGRGRGAEVIYPAGTLAQLDAVLDIRRQKHTDRPAWLRPLLWWECRAVAWPRVREDFRTLLEPVRQAIAAAQDDPERALDAIVRETAGIIDSPTAYVVGSFAVTGRGPYPLDEPFDHEVPDSPTPGREIERATGLDTNTLARVVAEGLFNVPAFIETLPTVMEEEAACVRTILHNPEIRRERESRMRRLPGARRSTEQGLKALGLIVGELVWLFRQAGVVLDAGAADALKPLAPPGADAGAAAVRHD